MIQKWKNPLVFPSISDRRCSIQVTLKSRIITTLFCVQQVIIMGRLILWDIIEWVGHDGFHPRTERSTCRVPHRRSRPRTTCRGSKANWDIGSADIGTHRRIASAERERQCLLTHDAQTWSRIWARCNLLKFFAKPRSRDGGSRLCLLSQSHRHWRETWPFSPKSITVLMKTRANTFFATPLRLWTMFLSFKLKLGRKRLFYGRYPTHGVVTAHSQWDKTSLLMKSEHPLSECNNINIVLRSPT